LKPNNEYGASYGEISKNCLSKTSITSNPFKLSSTGSNYRKHGKKNCKKDKGVKMYAYPFKFNQIDFKDPSLTAFSHKYGATTLLKNHPSVDVNILY
jgi:hypothetical protein